ncbi:hypothetical protein TNCV_4949181 [Trichonephila clavipes]|nr:hypothetical protein TNCV_4949181 [Trichonephila clavipes]
MRKESEPAVKNYSKKSYVGNYENLYITDAYFVVGMNTPFAAKVHAVSLAGRNTMTVGVAPFHNIVDGSLQLSFNDAHIRAFTTDLQVIDIKRSLYRGR